MTNLKPIEFGIFMPVANNGWIMSRNSPQYMPTWELNRAVGLLAEEIGLHYLFSMGKWRGLDGETEFWNYTAEAMALSASLAVATSRVRIVASVAPLLIHPAVMAKMISTIDDVSGGRISINIITSGNQQEYGQMGLQPADWDSYRYDYIEEWLEAARRLWTEDRVNLEGKWFTLTDCMCNPKPVQKPHPRVVCAMASDRGYQFVAERCDEAFFGGSSIESKKEACRKARAAAAKSGRQIKTQTLINIIQGDTDAEAEAMIRYWWDGADHEAISRVTFGPPDQRLFYGGVPMTGGPGRIADMLADLAIDGDMDGILLTFPDFIEGLKKFRVGVLPLLASRGLELAPQDPSGGPRSATLPYATAHA